MSQYEYQLAKQSFSKLLSQLQQSLFSEKYGSMKNILQNLEYRFNDPELHQYIPQLCYLYFVTNQEELRTLLMGYAYQNIQNYFILDWTLKAYSENPNGITIHKGYQELRSVLYSINKKLSEQFVNKGTKLQCFYKENTLDDAFQLKDARATYLDRQDYLLFNLIEQSLRLKKVEVGLRKAHMSEFLRKINQNIEYLQKYLLPQYGGITIPFNHDESSLIVNIIEDEFICFNTAKRVPYKIIIETVDPCEIHVINNSILEQAPELQEYYDIETQMKAISQLKIFHSYNLDELKKLAHTKIDQFKKLDKRIIDKDIYQSSYVSNSPWGEDWEITSIKFRQQSQYGNLKSYRVRQIIVKGGDDLRSELLVMQMMRKVASVFEQWGLQIYLKPYDIILTSPNSGILEFIPNTLSMDRIKKEYPDYSLKQFYEIFFDNFEEAQKNFAQSLAGYSLICYLFQLKDRHNGNILIDNKGHIIHIDFGFILTLTPGNMNFESAPFKLIAEYEELLGGKGSDIYEYYKILIASGFLALKEHVDEIIMYLKLMLSSPKHNQLQCLQNFKLEVFRYRFHEKENQIHQFVNYLVEDASNALSTRIYDYYQYKSNTIYY